MGFTDLSAHAFGLRTEMQVRINQMLQAYDPKLTLRRINTSDPAYAAGQKFTPPKEFGVWEEPVLRGETNWVFLLPESAIHGQVLVRVAENDFSRTNPHEKFNRLLAEDQFRQAGMLKDQNDKFEEKRDQMMTVGKLARRHGAVRMKINGEDVILDDTIRPVRKFIT